MVCTTTTLDNTISAGRSSGPSTTKASRPAYERMPMTSGCWLPQDDNGYPWSRSRGLLCADLTKVHVASTRFTARAARASVTSCSTPCERVMTVPRSLPPGCRSRRSLAGEVFDDTGVVDQRPQSAPAPARTPPRRTSQCPLDTPTKACSDTLMSTDFLFCPRIAHRPDSSGCHSVQQEAGRA